MTDSLSFCREQRMLKSRTPSSLKLREGYAGAHSVELSDQKHLELGVVAQDAAAQLLQALRLLGGRGHHDELKGVRQRVQDARQPLQLLHRKFGPACAASPLSKQGILGNGLAIVCEELQHKDLVYIRTFGGPRRSPQQKHDTSRQVACPSLPEDTCA